MGIRFNAPPHYETALINENETRMRNERFLRSWANDPRAASDAIIYSEQVGARGAGDAPAVINTVASGMPIDDDVLNLAMSEDLALGREEAGEMWDDPLANDTFDFSRNPGKLGAEVLGWYQRSPGEFLGENPVTGSAAVKGVSRWFMMAADVAVDTVTDRVVAAAAQASAETGKIGWDNLDDFGGAFAEEYFTGEDIGNKPFFTSFANAIQQESENQGTGYMVNSDLAPDVQLGMENFDVDAAAYAQNAQQAFDTRETDPDQWWENNAKYATPESQVQWWTDQNRQSTFSRLVSESDAQKALGDPYTQKSQFKQDALGLTVGGGATNIFTTVQGDAQGRGHYTRSSMGRLTASIVSEPGTAMYHNISGGMDFTKQVMWDPLNYVGIGAIGKANQARRAIGLTGDAARHIDDLSTIEKGVRAIRAAPTPYGQGEIQKLKKAGVMFEENPQLIKELVGQPIEADAILLAQRSRKTVVGDDANKWLTGSQAQPMVDALREADSMRQVDAILSRNTSRIDSTMRGQLRDAKTNSEVIEALMPHVTGMQLSGNMRHSAGISAFKSSDMLTRPLGVLKDSLYLGVDGAAKAGLDRMYQVQQRGVMGALDPRGMLPGIDSKHLDMPMANLNSRAQTRNLLGDTWAGRMVNNQSNSAIRTDDIDVGYMALQRQVRNFEMAEDLKIGKTKSGKVVQGSTMDELNAAAKELGSPVVQKSVIDVDEQMYRFSQLGNGNDAGAFRVAREIWGAAALKMEADDIDPIFIRAATALMDDQGQNALFFTNAMGETGKYPGTGFQAMLGGEIYAQPGPQLVRELFSGNINVPDPRLLRRTLAEKGAVRSQMNALTTNKVRKLKTADIDGFKGVKRVVGGDLQDRAAMRYARAYISNIWKPAKLLRFGYIPKVVLGDEQARMTASGLSTMWAPGRISKGASPLAYISYMLGSPADRRFAFQRAIPIGGKKGATDIQGNPLKAAQEYMDTVSLRGNSFGEVGAMRSDSWERALRGSDEYVDGLATEWVQLGSDPIVQKLTTSTGSDAIAETRKWLLEDAEGQAVMETIYRAMRDQNPMTAETFKAGGQELTNYLEWTNARLHLKTGGDYVFRDPNTKAVMSSADIPVSGYDDVGDGITIIRQGDQELIDGIRLQDMDGVNLNNLDDAGYSKLRQIARDRVKTTEEAFSEVGDTAATRFPEAVKYNDGVGLSSTDPKMIKRVVNGMMDWIVSRPASYLNRAPAFKQFYWEAIGERLPYMTDELAATVEAAAKKAKVWRKVKYARDDVARNNDVVKTLDSMDDVDLYAKSYAATEVTDLLFDFAEKKNMFDAIGLISPFADAWLELFTSWGRLFANDPRMVRRPLTALDELRRDDPLEWGMDEYDENEGFFHQNAYGDEVFSIPGSAAITKALGKLPGISEDLPEMNFDVEVGGLNMIATQLYPGAGDLVTIPASQLIPKSPEYKWLRENLAPFGLPDSPREGLLDATVGASPTLNRFINGWSEGKLGGGQQERIFNQTTSWMVRDMIASGEVTAADLQDPDKNAGILATARARAQDVYLIRGIMQFSLPAAPGQPEFISDPSGLDDMDPDQAQSLIALNDTAQTYYDILKGEARGDDMVAMEIFTDKYGFNPMMHLVSTSGAEWKRGVTEGAYDFETTHADWFETFGATAYYLRPDREDDDFYYEAWADQFEEGTRTEKPLSEQVDEYIYRMADLEYRQAEKTISEGLADGSIQVPEGEDQEAFAKTILAEVDRSIKESFPDYEAQKGNYSEEKQKTMVLELQQWSEHSDIAASDTGEAVDTFFGVWDEMASIQKVERPPNDTFTADKTLPFRNSNATVGGEAWQQRAIVNSALLEIGNEMALEPGNGNFATLWEEVIRPTIYDYTQDVGMSQNEPERVIEDKRLADQDALLKEWGL